MSTLLIQHADIVTLDDAGTIHYDIDVYIAGGVIAAIGKGLDHTADEVIDASGKVLMPGFFNAHSHAAMTFERGWAEDLPFDRWLNEKIWVAESALTPDDVYWGSMLAIAEMIRCGVVAFNDHYFYMDRVAQAVAESGIRANLTNCVFGLGLEQEVGDGIEDALDLIQNHHNTLDGRLRTSLGPHSPYICPPEFLAEIAKFARQLDVAVHIHLSESWEQVENSKEKYGKTPVQELADLGVFDGHTVAAHCLALLDDDFTILADYGVYVARTPITYMKLAMPANQIKTLREAGIPVAFGSDGPGSNNDIDMLAVLRQAAMLEKYKAEDPTQMAGDLPLRLATQSGAAAMGFANSGSIELGKNADVILIDFDQPHLRPRHSLIANLTFNAKGGDVTHTIVAGDVLMRDRQLTTLNMQDIMTQAEKRAYRLVGEDMQLMRRYDA